MNFNLKNQDFLMFYQFFLSPQVKRCAIITYKHGVDLRKLRNIRRLSKLNRMKILPTQAKIVSASPKYPSPGCAQPTTAAKLAQREPCDRKYIYNIYHFLNC